MVGKQEQTLSLITRQAGAVAANVPPQAGQQPPPANGDTIRRHEVDAIFNHQNQVQSIVSEVR